MARAIVVAAPASGSGKTVVTLGLLRALRNRGLKVSSAKIGPDYIDTRFHEAATGRPCFNLDPWAMDDSQIAAIVLDAVRDADIVIIEGVMGLFDGPRGKVRGSTADLAQLLQLPVLLTVDARHQGQSVAALVHGFTQYKPGLTCRGVILNRVASDRHEAILREALDEPVLGVLRQDDSLHLPSRHLGLVQAEENQDLEHFLERAASAVAHETILDRILGIAAQPLAESVIRESLPPLGQKIAIARDRAFAFTYPHLLAGWRRLGAELSFFSPLANEVPLADADAVFLPGGYPELHAGRLAACSAFLDGLRSARGLVYGECGGYMVLGESLTDADGHIHAMAGLLPVATSFATRKLHLGYRSLTPLKGSPWTGLLKGHEFHYCTELSKGVGDPLFAAVDSIGDPLPPMGLRCGNVMGSFAHLICEAA